MSSPEENRSPARPDRRCFLKWSAALGGSALASGYLGLDWVPMGSSAAGDELLVRTCCPAHNCGGKCVLIAHVREGVITRISTDDRPTDDVSDPQLRACARGRAYRRRQYHPDRLRHPLRRSGPRGEGRFERISWDAALDLVAAELERVKARHGNEAIYVPYGTGSYSNTNGKSTVDRLINLFGGCLGYYNSYSWACISRATPTVYGTSVTGNHRQDWLRSRYVLMWGWNPAEMRDGTATSFILKRARARGARVVCIDPRMSPSAVSLADEWVPIRPGTDAAMMSAMAHVMITEGLHDEEFVRRCCVGFDAAQMPPGAEGEESYSEYILGTRDGVPKTPEWAEAITAVPAKIIARIAREYATRRPGVLYQGYGMQRRAYGEQVVRAGCVLAAISGNVGVPGGWASGMALNPGWRPSWTVFPRLSNPVSARIPSFLWTEAVLRGHEMGPADGVRGAERLPSDIKLIYAVASDCLVNQHANVNRTARILRDESKVEFLVVQDQFLTPTARFADVVLPACTQLEVIGLQDGWKYGNGVIFSPQVVEPLAECKSDYRICSELASRLGLEAEYTQGRSERDWVAWAIEHYRRTGLPDIPTLEEFERGASNVHSVPVTEPEVAFAEFRRDPEAHPLSTPTGKVEIFSKRLHDLGRPDEIPAVPKYIEEWESPFGPEAQRFPLSLIGHHCFARVHSTHANNDWLTEAFPQRAFVNPVDAAARGIESGDEVRIYNERGAIALPCRVTRRIMPGAVAVPQGAWWTPDASGTCRHGSVNTLTSERCTPYAFGNAQHTTMVQLERMEAS